MGLDSLPVQIAVIEVAIGLQAQNRRDAVLGFQMVDVIGVGGA